MRIDLRTWIIGSSLLGLAACGGKEGTAYMPMAVPVPTAPRAGTSAGVSGTGEAGRGVAGTSTPVGDLKMAVATLMPLPPEPKAAGAGGAGADGAGTGGSTAGASGATAGAGGASAGAGGASAGAGGANGGAGGAGGAAAGRGGSGGRASSRATPAPLIFGRGGTGGTSGTGGSGGRSGSGGGGAGGATAGASGMTAGAGGITAGAGGATAGASGAAGARAGAAGRGPLKGPMGTATFTNLGHSVELSIALTMCTAGKAYPVHIHEGTACTDAMTQGAHWDPPRGEGIPDIACATSVGSVLYQRAHDDPKPWNVGGDDNMKNVVGHVVVVHDADNPMLRIACGQIVAK